MLTSSNRISCLLKKWGTTCNIKYIVSTVWWYRKQMHRLENILKRTQQSNWGLGEFWKGEKGEPKWYHKIIQHTLELISGNSEAIYSSHLSSREWGTEDTVQELMDTNGGGKIKNTQGELRGAQKIWTYDKKALGDRENKTTEPWVIHMVILMLNTIKQASALAPYPGWW